MTLAWHPEDVKAILGSVTEPYGESYQFFDIPIANYGAAGYDSVLDAGGKVVGYSMFSGFSANERKALSLATVDPSVEIGSEVHVVWGEPEGGTSKLTVDPHKQIHVRAIVSPIPYAEVVRATYHEGWRSEAASA